MDFKLKIQNSKIGKISAGVIFSLLPLIFLALHPVSPVYTEVDKDVPLDPVFFENGIEEKTRENSIFFGKQNLVYFGYLNCRTVCHGALAKLKKVALKTQNKTSQIVLVSLDPEAESSEKWERTLSEISKGQILVIKPASSEKSFELAKLFGNRSYRNAVTSEIEHQDILFWVDAEAKIKGIFPDFSENETLNPTQISKLIE